MNCDLHFDRVLTRIIFLISANFVSSGYYQNTECFDRFNSNGGRLSNCKWHVLSTSTQVIITCKFYLELRTDTKDFTVNSRWLRGELHFRSDEILTKNNTYYELYLHKILLEENSKLSERNFDRSAARFGICNTQEIRYILNEILEEFYINIDIQKKLKIQVAILNTSEPFRNISKTDSSCECDVTIVPTHLITLNEQPPNNLSSIIANWFQLSKAATFSEMRVTLNQNIAVLPYNIVSFMNNLNVIRLIVKNSQLKSIEDTSLPHLTRLKTLIISNNKINSIDDSAFNSVPKLLELNLYGNRLTGIPKAIFNLTKLKYLSLCQNIPQTGLFRLHTGVNKSSELIQLHLDRTPLNYLPNNAFRYYPMLQELKLKDCTLNFIKEDAFAGIPKLYNLDISFNKIKELPSDVLVGLTRLNILSLEGNQLEFLNSSVFKPSTFIANLVLIGNGIKALPVDVFDGLSRVKSINLRNNEINSWDLGVFKSIPTLKSLELSANKIQFLNESMLDDIRNINTVRMHNNPFDCQSCSLSILQNWLRNQTLSVESMKNYRCAISEENSRRIHVLDATYRVDLCVIIPINYLLVAGTPLLVISLMIASCVLFSYKYRWYLRYLAFYIRIRINNRKKVIDTIYEYDVFISYSSKDFNFAMLIVRKLEKEYNLRVCIDERDFIAGDFIADNIVNGINNSRKIIFVLSENFLKSGYCSFELQMAQHRLFEVHNALILLKYGDIPKEMIGKKLSCLMKTRNYIQWYHNSESEPLFWLRLKNAVTRNLSALRDSSFV